MEKQFVAKLQIGDTVHSEFVVTEKTLLAFSQPNRAGEQYLRLQLADITGSIRAVAWERGPEMAKLFSTGDVIRVRGDVVNYNGPQLTVYDIERVAEHEIKKHYFIKTSKRSIEEMLEELQWTCNQVTEPHLRRLLEAFFKDKEFLASYAGAPAARSVHHNYLGGLLEHSLEVAALCRHFAGFYPDLDLSLLLCGALLHDIGKIEEYEIKGLAIEQTTRGKLIGHIMIGQVMVAEKVKSIGSFPENLYIELAHMLLSHHGQKEWGSPEIPRTFNAYALFHADLVSARLNQFAQAAEKGVNAEGWTQWNRLLGRDIFIGTAE